MMVDYSHEKANKLESKLNNFLAKVYVPIWKSRHDPQKQPACFPSHGASRVIDEDTLEPTVLPRFMYVGLVQLKDYTTERAKQQMNQKKLRQLCYVETQLIREKKSMGDWAPATPPEVEEIWNKTLRNAREMAGASGELSDKLDYIL